MSDQRPSPDKPALTGGSGADEYRRLEAERDALRKERDELKAEMARPKRAKRRRLRRFVVGLLVALSCLGVVLSTLVVWTHRTVLNTDVFVSTVGPVFENPEVTNQVATRATSQLFDALNLQSQLKDALPPKAGFIAGPATSGAKSFVSAQLGKVLSSSEFQKAWQRALRSTHTQVVAVLRGQSTPVLSTSGGTVVLNTVPLINQALGQLSGLTSNLVGKPVHFPTISSAELPQSTVDKLSKTLGVQLPSNFGQITLFQSDQLSTVQKGVNAFDGLTVLLPILTLVAIALSLWLSLSRRRTLVQFLAVSGLLIIVVRRLVDHLQGTFSAKSNNPDVANQVLGQLLHGLFVMTAWLLGLALFILAVALVTGPYRWAVRLRSVVAGLARRLSAVASGPRRRQAAGWIRVHADLLRLGGAVLAGVLLLVVSVSWVSFLVIGIALVLYEILVNRICASQPATEGATANEGASADEGESSGDGEPEGGEPHEGEPSGRIGWAKRARAARGRPA